MTTRVFLDACVLFPPLVRGCLLSAAAEDLVAPCWSPGVVGEWAHAIARDHGPDAAAAVRAEAEAPGPEPGFTLPDAGDVHVLSAALAARADLLVTFNLRDFPARKLREMGLAPIHPDALLWELGGREPQAMGRALARALRPFPALSGAAEAAGGLKRARLPRLAKMVRRGEIAPAR